MYLTSPYTDGNLEYVHVFNGGAVTLSSNTSKNAVVYDTKPLSFVDTTRHNYDYTLLPDEPAMYCYYAKGNTGTMWLAKVDYETGTVTMENTITINLPDNYRQYVLSNSMVAGINNDGIYLLLHPSDGGTYDYHLFKFDFSGNCIDRASAATFGQGLKMYYVGGKWRIGSATSSGKHIYSLDALEHLYYDRSGGCAASYSAVDIAPFYLSVGSLPGYKDTYLNLYYPYIGTINNLAEAVNKTSAQTMKITYELTNLTVSDDKGG